MNRFSEDTLSKTLDAVRSRRHRRRNSRRAAASLAIVLGVASFTYWTVREQAPLDVSHSPKVATQHPHEYPVRPSPAIQVFATEELNPKVILLDDSGLDRMFRGRSYGTYVASDGHRRLWVPES